MNGQTHSQSFGVDIFQQGMILIAAVGFGLLSIRYSPFYALGGALLFSVLSVTLYINSFQTSESEISSLGAEEEKTRRSFLFNIFYLSFCLSITIPKAGRTYSNFPITVANLCILFTLFFWALRFIFTKNSSSSIPLFKSSAVFILYGGVAAVIGFINGNSYKYILLDFVVFVGFLPVYFLVCSVIKTRKQLRLIVIAVLIGMVLVCLYGALQPRLGFERIAVSGITQQYNMESYAGVGKWNVIEGGGQKVYSTFQNGNVFGNHLAMFIPLVGGIWLGLSSSTFRTKMFLSGIFLLACYTLLITYSRGALVSAVGGIFFLAFAAKKIRLKAIIIAVIILAVLLGFMLYYADRPELTRYDFRRMKDDPNRFSAGRLQRIEYVLDHFQHFSFAEKLLGRGFGSGLSVPQRSGYTDNLYLTLLFKFGLIGLVLLFWLFFQFFRLLLRFYSRTTDEQLKGIIAGGTAGMVAASIHYLADTLWLFPPLAANFWFLAGIAVMAGVLGSQTTLTKEQGTGSISSTR